MKRKEKKKGQQLTTAALSVVSVVLALCCLSIRLPDILSANENTISLFAAGLVLPQGGRALGEKDRDNVSSSLEAGNASSEAGEPQGGEHSSSPAESSQVSSTSGSSGESSSKEEGKSTSSTPKKNEKKFGIIEMQFGASGMNYNNFYIKNATGTTLDVKKELQKTPDVKIKKNGEPQVLIMHTHTCESFMDEDLGYYYESFYSRNTDNKYNVTQVGDAIEAKLKAAGIGVIHDTTKHDDPSYNGSYNRARNTIQKNLKKYPSIQVVLDIHRDGLMKDTKEKIKPTCVINGQKAAQIMIISGCDTDGSLAFPDWEYNLRLALRLQQSAENMYPGITRPLYFSQTKYNMDMTHGSLLIEVGSDSNTLQEAVRTGGYLGDILVDVLNGLT